MTWRRPRRPLPSPSADCIMSPTTTPAMESRSALASTSDGETEAGHRWEHRGFRVLDDHRPARLLDVPRSGRAVDFRSQSGSTAVRSLAVDPWRHFLSRRSIDGAIVPRFGRRRRSWSSTISTSRLDGMTKITPSSSAADVSVTRIGRLAWRKGSRPGGWAGVDRGAGRRRSERGGRRAGWRPRSTAPRLPPRKSR